MKFDNMNIIWNENLFNLSHFVDFKSTNEIRNFKQSKSLIVMKRSPQLLYAICMCLEKGITYIPID